MSTDFSLSRWALRLLTEAECKRVASRKNLDIVEWETIGFTFFRSDQDLAILRTGAMGGDLREIHGGWKYLTLLGLDKEWAEIKSLLPAFSPTKRTQ